MSRPAALAAGALAGLLGLTAAAPVARPAPVATAGGLRYPVAAAQAGLAPLVSETDAGAALAGVQIFVSAGLDREPRGLNGVASIVAECLVRTPVDGVPLRDAVAATGGSLTYTVEGTSVHYYLEGRADRLGALVATARRAFAAPDFSSGAVAAAKARLGARIADGDANALATAVQMFRQAYYPGGTGAPPSGTAASLDRLTAADAASFFAATYVRRSIAASAVGGASADLGAALASLAQALPDTPVAAVGGRPRAIPEHAPRIIARRDVAAPWIVVGYAAPSPSSRDFGAMLVLQSLLADTFRSTGTTSPDAVERSVGASYLFDAAPASLVVYVNGAAVDPTSALREVLVIVRSLGVRPLPETALRRFKTLAAGEFALGSVTLSDRSYLLGTLAAQGLGPDAVNAAIGSLERTTSADVQRAAKTYLQRCIVSLVLPRATPAGG